MSIPRQIAEDLGDFLKWFRVVPVVRLTCLESLIEGLGLPVMEWAAGVFVHDVKVAAESRELSARGYHQAGKLDYALMIAPILRTHAPDKLPADICFDFACMQSREGDTEEAEKWLEVAFENADDVDAMRLKALDHADLEPVWGQIGWV